MSGVFTKLNWKNQPTVVVLDAPASFDAEIAALADVRVVRDATGEQAIPFAITFVMSQEAVDAATQLLVPRLADDAVLWFAYPKQSSKRYHCSFNRDTGWAVLGDAGFEGVRQVAIDEDWSALRFRHIDKIKNYTRDISRATSAEGRRRAGTP
jgi:hypothetical protein